MIPREILKKIRPSERRTNCHALRLGLRPQPRSVEERIQSVFSSALTYVLSPGRGFQPATLSVNSAVYPTNPAAGYSKDAGSVSPSPWGEGRDEGGQNHPNLTVRCAKSVSCCNIMPCNHRAEVWAGLADDAAHFADARERCADAPAKFADDRDAIADDTDQVADDRERFAEGRERVAESAASGANHLVRFAEGTVAFAEESDLIAERWEQNATVQILFAERTDRSAEVMRRHAGRSVGCVHYPFSNWRGQDSFCHSSASHPFRHDSPRDS